MVNATALFANAKTFLSVYGPDRIQDNATELDLAAQELMETVLLGGSVPDGITILADYLDWFATVNANGGYTLDAHPFDVHFIQDNEQTRAALLNTFDWENAPYFRWEDVRETEIIRNGGSFVRPALWGPYIPEFSQVFDRDTIREHRIPLDLLHNATDRFFLHESRNIFNGILQTEAEGLIQTEWVDTVRAALVGNLPLFPLRNALALLSVYTEGNPNIRNSTYRIFNPGGAPDLSFLALDTDTIHLD